MNFFVRLSVASWFLKVLSTLTFMLQLRDFYLVFTSYPMYYNLIILVSQAEHSVEDPSQEHTSTNDKGDVPYVESVVENDGAEITEKSDQAESLTGM